MSGYNTNLAAEFHVLSIMHRMGIDATLTLGNKKSVDIVVVKSERETLTVDVKGLAGNTGWPVDNVDLDKGTHFIVLVCYKGKIDDPAVSPDVYIVPPSELKSLIYTARPSGRRLINCSTMKTKGIHFRDAWHLLR